MEWVFRAGCDNGSHPSGAVTTEGTAPWARPTLVRNWPARPTPPVGARGDGAIADESRPAVRADAAHRHRQDRHLLDCRPSSDLNRPRLPTLRMALPTARSAAPATRSSGSGSAPTTISSPPVAEGSVPAPGRYADAAELRREVPRRLLAEVRTLRSGAGAPLRRSALRLTGAGLTSPAAVHGRARVGGPAGLLPAAPGRPPGEPLPAGGQGPGDPDPRGAGRPARTCRRRTTTTHGCRPGCGSSSPTLPVVRRFERGQLRRGSRYPDFVHAAGLEIPTADVPTADRNESLDADAGGSPTAAQPLPPGARRRAPARRTAGWCHCWPRAAPGPTLTLPDAELRTVHGAVDRTQGAGRPGLLGEPGGPLFTAPRKGSATTTNSGWTRPCSTATSQALPRTARPGRGTPCAGVAEREAAR